MPKKPEYDYQGSVHYFKKKPPQKSSFDTFCEWVGIAIAIFFILALLGSCTDNTDNTVKTGGLQSPVTREASLSLYMPQ
ncbi:MAG: hypothetical protein R3D71_08315 [Rickettsiales bacterium]